MDYSWINFTENKRSIKGVLSHVYMFLMSIKFKRGKN